MLNGATLKVKNVYLMVVQRILHGECLDELLRADKTQSVLKAENRGRKKIRTILMVRYKRKMINNDDSKKFKSNKHGFEHEIMLFVRKESYNLRVSGEKKQTMS